MTCNQPALDAGFFCKHVMKNIIFLLTLLPAATSAQVSQLTVEQATSGAAAVVTLAQKCQPAQVEHFKSAALARMRELLSYQSESDYKISEDWAKMKIKAFAISSGNLSCEKAHNMWFYAEHWGFRDFIRK